MIDLLKKMSDTRRKWKISILVIIDKAKKIPTVGDRTVYLWETGNSFDKTSEGVIIGNISAKWISFSILVDDLHTVSSLLIGN